MDATDVLANRQNGVPRTSLLVCAGLAVMSLTACNPKPPEGISVICDSNGQNKYSKWFPGPCALPDGGITDNCYHLVPAGPIFKCYGSDEWLAAETGDGEPEEAAETEGMVTEGMVPKGIDRESWPTHEPSLAHIRTYCTGECRYIHAEQSGEDPTCENEHWDIFGYDGEILHRVLATLIEDPGALNCDPYLGKRKRPPAKSHVVPIDSVTWPSDGATIDLACATVQTCAELFDENVIGHLAHSSLTPPGHNEAEADYLATAGISSTMWLRIANPDNPSEGTNPVEGRIEYTAPDCGQPTCPLYLGNLTVTNTSDTWDLHSEALAADMEISNLHARLRVPALGVWRPVTGEVYLDAEMLELRVDFDLAVADAPATAVTKYVTNGGGIFGIIHGNHAIELTNLSVRAEDLEANATLDFDSVDGSPPVASFTLPPTVVLGRFDLGLLVSTIPEISTDPDGDLDWKLWLIDGQQVAPGHVIPAGHHTIRLEVRDSRFAFDMHEQPVTITYGEQD